MAIKLDLDKFPTAKTPETKRDKRIARRVWPWDDLDKPQELQDNQETTGLSSNQVIISDESRSVLSHDSKESMIRNESSPVSDQDMKQTMNQIKSRPEKDLDFKQIMTCSESSSFTDHDSRQAITHFESRSKIDLDHAEPRPIVKQTKIETAHDLLQTKVQNRSWSEKDLDNTESLPGESFGRPQDKSIELFNTAYASLGKGFSRVPNSLYMTLCGPHLGKSEMKVFMVILRFTLGFHRPRAPISVNVFKKMTGLSTTNIRKGFKELSRLGLIQIFSGSQERASEFSPNFDPSVFAREGQGDAEPRKLGLQDSSSESDQGSEQIKVQNESRSTLDPGSNSVMTRNEEYKKDKETITLSRQDQEKLDKYFSDLKPKRKRESEEYLFRELKKEYTQTQILSCFVEIQKHGDLNSGSTVHSPFAYLSKAMAEVLARVEKRHQKQAQTDEERQAAKHRENEAKQRQEKEEEVWKTAKQQFDSEFDSEKKRDRFFDEYRKAGKGRAVLPVNLLERLAILEWFREQNQNKELGHNIRDESP